MAMFDNIFSGNNGIANKLVDMFGTKAFFVTEATHVYDPRTDTYSGAGTTRKEITITPMTKYKSYELANTSILSTDCKTTVKYTDIPSDIQNGVDYIEYNNEKYVIVENSKVYTGDSIAVINLQLRKVV